MLENGMASIVEKSKIISGQVRLVPISMLLKNDLRRVEIQPLNPPHTRSFRTQIGHNDRIQGTAIGIDTGKWEYRYK